MLPETDFINRHIGPRKLEKQEMLQAIGLKNINALIEKTIPKNIKSNEDLNFAKTRLKNEQEKVEVILKNFNSEILQKNIELIEDVKEKIIKIKRRK